MTIYKLNFLVSPSHSLREGSAPTSMMCVYLPCEEGHFTDSWVLGHRPTFSASMNWQVHAAGEGGGKKKKILPSPEIQPG